MLLSGSKSLFGALAKGTKLSVIDDAHMLCFAVQFATWLKRQIALKPALARIRKQRAEQRTVLTTQVDDMY